LRTQEEETAGKDKESKRLPRFQLELHSREGLLFRKESREIDLEEEKKERQKYKSMNEDSSPCTHSFPFLVLRSLVWEEETLFLSLMMHE
jgi:hypothetical protein